LESQLLDIRDCRKSEYQSIYQELLNISLFQQPRWFRPFLIRSHYLQKIVGHNHWSRAWENPWAILASELKNCSLKILDVGGGGSPLAIYLEKKNNETYVIDPSLNQGMDMFINTNKGFFRNIRSLIFHSILVLSGVRTAWGKPRRYESNSVRYFPYSATDMDFPDNSFDRVFCLSVMEHISLKSWKMCIKEFERVLKPEGRIIVTLDMSATKANQRQYIRLVEYCSLKLVGDPHYEVPISTKDKNMRHPGHVYETMGLVWQG